MLEKRPILIAVIGYILGILMGLYCKISIVLFYVLIFLVYVVAKNKKRKNEFKLFSIRRYSRYVKILFNKSVLKIIIIFSIISNTIVLFENYKYENLYSNLDGKNCKLNGIVCEVEEKRIKVKITNIKYKNTYLYIYKETEEIKYGDKIAFDGIFMKTEKRSNYKGFDRFEYYKTKKIYGTVKCEKISILAKNTGWSFKKFTNYIASKINEEFEKSNLKKEEKAMLKGMILGKKDDMEEKTIENFNKSNISYILAVSGMHVSYIILFSEFIFKKISGKHYSKLMSSITILIYMSIVNFTPSIVRAGVTGIIMVMSNFVYRKNDTFEALSIALLIILVQNPFAIKDIGLQLSFGATIGIVIFQEQLKKIYEIWVEKINRRVIRKGKRNFVIDVLNSKIAKIFIDSIILTISASILVVPILILSFNMLPFFSLIISIIAGFIVGPIMILGIIFIFIKIEIIKILLSMLIKSLIFLSNLGSQMLLNQIYIVTPSIGTVVIYYIFILIFNFMIKIYLEKNPNMFEQRIKNIRSLIKYKIKLCSKKIILLVLIVSILNIFVSGIPKNLRVYFVDVGQGDSTLILTPKNKSILIDGGGSESKDSNYNVGKSVLMPYLLDRKIAVIDYVIFSHMDSDHAQGLLYVIENMKVKNIVIGRQFENSKNFENLIKIVNNKKINIVVVEKGDIIHVENNVFFKVLWPDSNQMISDNAINNNSLVCKLEYKNFSMLFTGDIEKIAEMKILEIYKKNLNLLKSSVLKVAHHGSKTSSCLEFVEAVKPKISLIGVGKNNKFGHPSDITLKNLEKTRFYRTDEMGEISIVSDGKKYKIETFIKK